MPRSGFAIVLLLLAAFHAMGIIARALRPPLSIRRAVCGACGYESDAQSRCPECGRSPLSAGIATPQLALKLGSSPASVALALLLLISLSGAYAWEIASSQLSRAGDARMQAAATFDPPSGAGCRFEVSTDAIVNSPATTVRRGTIVVVVYATTPATEPRSEPPPLVNAPPRPGAPKAVVDMRSGRTSTYDSAGTRTMRRADFDLAAAEALYAAAGLDPKSPGGINDCLALVSTIRAERTLPAAGTRSGPLSRALPMNPYSTAVSMGPAPPAVSFGFSHQRLALLGTVIVGSLLYVVLLLLILHRRRARMVPPPPIETQTAM